MAVYTDVTADDLTEFLSRYEIGELRSYKGIAEGVENSNFLLHTASRQFHPHALREARRRADLPFFLGLMEHLASARHHLPAAGQEPAGRRARQARRPAGGDRHLSRRPVDAPADRRPLRGGGRGAGAACISPARIFRASAPTRCRSTAGAPLYEHAGVRGDSVRPGLCDEIAKELDALEKSWPRDLPEGVIHADLFPDNVFFLGDELSGLIDFYFACTDTLAYDVAVCLNAWCFEPDHSYNVTKGRALLKAYAQRARALGGGDARRCPCWRAARRCAFC